MKKLEYWNGAFDFQNWTDEDYLEFTPHDVDDFQLCDRVVLPGILPGKYDGTPLTEDELKERRLEFKQAYYIKMLELGLFADTAELREKYGFGYYRENKGYNKYNEWCCSQCKEYKPRTVEYFPKDKRRAYGLGYVCRECSKSNSRAYYKQKKKELVEKQNQDVNIDI